MKHFIFIFISSLALLFTNASADNNVQLPDLTMPDNNLTFETIQGYENYHIVASHFRMDKNEIRYILANQIAFDALQKNTTTMPEGSIFVKIGWDIQTMSLFPVALEAKELQRVEYMIKDSKRFDHDGDHWGYARFVKKDGKYSSWDKGTHSCISCHVGAKDNDYLFTKLQKIY